MLDALAWEESEELVRELVAEIVAPYGVTAEVDYRRGVPPVVNEFHAAQLLASAVRRVVGVAGQVQTTQSLGGEDFGWYLDSVPGAMARLGVRTPGQERPHDLHQGTFDIDERALAAARR